MNAVSDKLFSDAIACITSSLAGSVSTQTAAGFPEKSSVVNASTWYIGSVSIPVIPTLSFPVVST